MKNLKKFFEPIMYVFFATANQYWKTINVKEVIEQKFKN